MTQTGKNNFVYDTTLKSVELIVTGVQSLFYTLLTIKDDVTDGLGLILGEKAL